MPLSKVQLEIRCCHRFPLNMCGNKISCFPLLPQDFSPVAIMFFLAEPAYYMYYGGHRD